MIFVVGISNMSSAMCVILKKSRTSWASKIPNGIAIADRIVIVDR